MLYLAVCQIPVGYSTVGFGSKFWSGGGGKKGEVNATIYIVDSTTGQVLASTSVVGTSKDRGLRVGYNTGSWGAAFGGHKKDNVGKAVEAACGKAVEFLIGQLPNIPWMGSVVLTKGSKVYINRGSREGVQAGQEFVIGESEQFLMICRPPTSSLQPRVLLESLKSRAPSRPLNVALVRTVYPFSLLQGRA